MGLLCGWQTTEAAQARGQGEMGRVYSTAVASLLAGNRTAEARGVYERALGAGVDMDRRGYDAMVAGAAASDDPALSVFFVAEMKQRLLPQGCVVCVGQPLPAHPHALRGR